MARRPLIWQLFSAFLLVIVLTLGGVSLLFATIEDMPLRIAAGAVVVVGMAGAVSWWLSQRIVQPIARMKQSAVRFAAGEVSQPMEVPQSLELAELAEALNQMASQLDHRIRTATEQRNEREAILSSMMEGVIAVDSQQRIISMNRAAAELFGAQPAQVQGKSIRHAVRNQRLVDLIAQAQQDSESISQELVLQNAAGEIVLQAHAAALRDARGAVMGVVVVLDDITSMRRLERVRSDFVANVSHELRTPITSIKGFVETLLSGETSEEDRQRFLEIVARQADRLNAIIRDLLMLSRLEQDEADSDSILSPGPVLPVIQSAVQLCGRAAIAKGVKISVTCSPQLRARINAPLLEQGLTNLMDNAIKYSEQGGEVEVRAERIGEELQLSVTDHGCGIAAEHLPRLFERFYRVDKARSRQLGGTGLGLAIVKHIAQTHGGRIEVESKPAAGSTFRIKLPALKPEHEAWEMVV